MKNKVLIFIGVGVFALLLAVGLLAGFGKINKKTLGENNNELDKYRSNEIPEECRVPEYEKNIESWKQHLSHHENTLYCLEYYE